MKKSTILTSILLSIFVLLLLFVIGFIFYIRKKQIYEPLTNDILFVNLVLYSSDEQYDKMYELTRNYYKKFKNVRTIYYKYNENLTSEYIIKDDVLVIRGKETYVPGILEKTLMAFDFIKNYEFDYLVRSNISTIINFDLLSEYLATNPIEYGGSLKMVLQWLDEPGGIVDETYWGTEYASGTSIIFSKSTLTDLLNYKDNIKKNLIDDVAIGVFAKEYLDVEPKYVPESRFISLPDENGDATKIIDLIKDKDYIFYRNRQPDRATDVAQMKIIIEYLQGNTNSISI